MQKKLYEVLEDTFIFNEFYAKGAKLWLLPKQAEYLVLNKQLAPA